MKKLSTDAQKSLVGYRVILQELMSASADTPQPEEDVESQLEHSVELTVIVTCSRSSIAPQGPQETSGNSEGEGDEEGEPKPIPTLEELECKFVLSVLGGDPEESEILSFVKKEENNAEDVTIDSDTRAKNATSSRPPSAKKSQGSEGTLDNDSGEERWSHRFTTSITVNEEMVCTDSQKHHYLSWLQIPRTSSDTRVI